MHHVEPDLALEGTTMPPSASLDHQVGQLTPKGHCPAMPRLLSARHEDVIGDYRDRMKTPFPTSLHLMMLINRVVLQANRYTVHDQDGNVVALLAEDLGGLGNVVGRQLLRTRRSFTATVLSPDGVFTRLYDPLGLFKGLCGTHGCEPQQSGHSSHAACKEYKCAFSPDTC